jgi:ribosomal protein S2
MTGVNYPIVANDATLGSIKFFTDEIAEAYREGLKKEEVTKS